MDWIEELRAACERLGQKEIGKRVGYSPTVLSQVLKGKYPGDMERVRVQVEGALMGREVDCPMLGEITLDVCRSHQNRRFSATNPLRVQMYRACRNGCPHSTICKR